MFDVCPSGWLEVEVNPCRTCRHFDSDIGFDYTVFDDTDFVCAKGSYSSSALPAGTYKVSVVENGVVKSNVTIKMAASTARVDFNHKPSAAANDKHYVLA